MILFGYRVGPLARATLREVIDDGVLGLAAGTAYYFFFSLFPLFLFLAPVLSLIGDKEKTFGWVITQLSGVVPPTAMQIVTDVVGEVVYSESAPGIMSLGALLAIWTGSNIFTSLIAALNNAYDVTEARPWWKQRLIAVAAVIAAGAAMLAATTLVLAGDRLAQFIGRKLDLGLNAVAVWSVIEVPLVFAIMISLAWLLYYFLPNVRQRPGRVLGGAIVATLLWILMTVLFRMYVTNFASYNKTYGAIGGVIVLLTWMYLSMLVLLIGGELNAEIAKGTGAVAPPTGAVYLGRISADGPSTPSTERVAVGRAPSTTPLDEPNPES